MSGQGAALPRDIVLLVDDSPEALGFLTDALEQSGFSALIATSGQAALNIAERITPDIILLDAVMPAMDGFETCRRLKANAAVAGACHLHDRADGNRTCGAGARIRRCRLSDQADQHR